MAKARKSKSRSLVSGAKGLTGPAGAGPLLDDVRRLIDETRQQVARTVNSAMVGLYWQIGKRVREDILYEQRAEYGEEIVSSLATQLTAEYGRGFDRTNLSRMVKIAEYFPDEEIVATLSQQLSWSHFRELLPLDDALKRDFYAEMCRLERWSVRTLRKKVGGMLFERTALSKKPDQLIRQELDALREEDHLAPDLVFRDPYLLGFLGLRDTYGEKDLEAAVLREMEAFILELGVGFAFLERQKRITVDDEDYYLDLLFYHRPLRRLVAIDLKIGDFRPGDAGQMEFYLRWLDKYERRADEEAPLGIILCAGKREETVRLLDLGKRGIQVSSYWTEVLPKDELQRKLHEAVRLARAHLARQAELPSPKEGSVDAQPPPKPSRRRRSKE